MFILINLLLVLGSGEDILASREDVILAFADYSFGIEDKDTVDPKGNLILFYWDVTKDGAKDCFITCDNCYTEDNKERIYSWTIYEKKDDRFSKLNHGMHFPMDMLLLKDNEEKIHLATTLYWKEGLNEPLTTLVLALEQDGDKAWEMPIIREIKGGEKTEEDDKWIQAGRNAAQEITEIFTPEDVAAIRAKKEAGSALPKMSPEQSSDAKIEDASSSSVKTAEEKSVAADDTQVIAIPEKQDAVLNAENAKSQTQESISIIVLTAAVLGFLILCLVASVSFRVIRKRKKHDV